MKNVSIPLKSVICASVYMVLSLSIILILYIMDSDLQNTLVLGALCGIAIAVVTYSGTLKRTITARFMGLISAVLSQFLLSATGIPYHIIMYIYKDEEWLHEIGHLTINELIGYGFGLMFFWLGLLASFCATVVIIFIGNRIKNY